MTQTIHVPDIINRSRISVFQYLVVLLCGLVLFLDGFDTPAISYMAPMMAKEWSLSAGWNWNQLEPKPGVKCP